MERKARGIEERIGHLGYRGYLLGMTENITPFNGLTPAEAERVAMMLGEAGEIVHACGKILQHGFESFSPNDPFKVTNRIYLLKEVADLSAIMFMMLEAGDIPHPPTDEQIQAKLDRVNKYQHHQS